MLTSLHLENFKAFGDRAVIPLAPITLIFGQNSSGKSSILQSLNLLKQTAESRESDMVLLPRTERGYVDLGSFREMLFDQDRNRTLKIRVNFDLSLFRSRLTLEGGPRASLPFPRIQPRVNRERGLELQFGSHPSENLLKLKKAELFHYNIENKPIIRFTGENVYGLDEEEAKLFMTKEESLIFDHSWEEEKDRSIYAKYMQTLPTMRCTEITKSKKFWLEFFTAITGKHPGFSLSKIENFLSEEESDFLINCDDFDNFIEWICNRALNMPVRANPLSRSYLHHYSRFDGSGMLPPTPFEEFKDEFLPIRRIGESAIQRIGRSINILLAKLYPLRPIRRSPTRWYIHGGFTPSGVGLEGEMLPDLLQRDRDLLEETNVWLKRLDIGYKIIVTPITATADLFEVRLQDIQRPHRATTVNLLDVGYGISQLLPFIVQSLAAKTRIISIEQPEVHIHPRLQADLGDLLIESIKRRNQLLVETHSEHLVLRLMRRVREGVLDKNNVSILYVTRGKEGSSVHPLRLDEDGDFIDDWPGGFFPERLNELV